MPSPTASLSTLRPDLQGSFEEFDLEANAAGLVASRIYPVIEVAKQSGNFGRIPLAELLKGRNTRRAPGAGYSRSEFEFTPDTYACVEHGAEEPVDDRESQMYSEYFDAERVSAARARTDLLLGYEERVVSEVTGASINATAVGAGGAWDTATGDPRDDVRLAKIRIRDATGQMANTVVFDWEVWEEIIDNPVIIDRLKYAGFTDPNPGTITRAAIAQALNVDQVLVSGAMFNAAGEGAAANLTSRWPRTQALVCVSARTQDIREACIGRTMHWSEDGSMFGGTVETYREEQVRSDIVRVRQDTDEKLLYAACGERITGVIT